MRLFERVSNYIKNSSVFDKNLAIDIIKFQIEHIPFYAEYIGTFKRRNTLSIENIPPFPVGLFKQHKITAIKNPSGFFISSGTTYREKSKIYYNKESLYLYKLSALRNFPLKNTEIYTTIPTNTKRHISSLCWMLHLLIENYRGGEINIDDISKIKQDAVLFTTAMHLLLFMQSGRQVMTPFYIIETGGYKKLKGYNRMHFYKKLRYHFPHARLYSEYGMTEMFSQFYANENTSYRIHPAAQVLTKGTGYLRVFDFANLFHISYIEVPDIIERNDIESFEFKKRDINDEKGCSYTFE